MKKAAKKYLITRAYNVHDQGNKRNLTLKTFCQITWLKLKPLHSRPSGCECRMYGPVGVFCFRAPKGPPQAFFLQKKGFFFLAARQQKKPSTLDSYSSGEPFEFKFSSLISILPIKNISFKELVVLNLPRWAKAPRQQKYEK